MAAAKTIFITATDTGVGKTMAAFVLGALLQSKGCSVGVLKPVQCGGNDAVFLQKKLNLSDGLDLINPIFVKEPLSPHLSLRRDGRTFDLKMITRAYQELKKRYNILLIEGAGGLMVPLADNYYTADLIKALKAEIIIVARLGLGSINHTLLTINQAQRHGLRIKGILFSTAHSKPLNIAEKTNPREIERLSGVNVLGTIPYLKTKTIDEVCRRCQKIRLDLLN